MNSIIILTNNISTVFNMKTLPEEYNFMIPLKSPSLFRLGVNRDGGYILDKKVLGISNFLISFGMAEEYSFETDFLKFSTNNKLIIFDFSISHTHYFKELLKNIRRIFKFKRNLSDLVICLKNYIKFIKFTNQNNVKFFSKKISSKINSKIDVSVEKIFENYIASQKNNIVLKIDIEGTEYDIINKILFYEKQVDQLVMEYHDTHLRKNEFFENIKKIQNYFYISHLHANNYRSYNPDGFPINIEITFLNKKFLNNSHKKNYKYPINDLDHPNNPKEKDLEFIFNNN